MAPISSILILFVTLSIAVVASDSNNNNNNQSTTQDPQLVELRLKSTPQGLFYGTVQVGGRPFNLLICSACETWWVPAVGERQFKQHYPTRRPMGSHSRLPRAGNGFGEAELDFHLDRVQLGDAHSAAPIDGALIGVAHQFEGPNVLHQYEHQVNGVLGFSVVADRDEPNPLKLLAQRGLIREPVVSLYLNWSEVPADSWGLLTFGGHNSQLLASGTSPMYIPMSSAWNTAMYRENFDKGKCHSVLQDVYLDWSRVLAMDGTGSTQSIPEEVAEFRFASQQLDPLGFNHADLSDPMGATRAELFLDSSAILFVGYQKYLDKYLIDFMGARRFGLAGNYVFEDCRLDNKPDFVFAFDNGVELRLEPRDYVVQDYEHPNGRRYCLAAFLGVQVNEWTLGTRFLRNYYTIFDYGNMRVGFVELRKPREPTN